ENRRECITDVKNELLNEISVKDDDARDKAEHPQDDGNAGLKERLPVQHIPPRLRAGCGAGTFIDCERLLILLINSSSIGMQRISHRRLDRGGDLIVLL